MVEAAMPGGVTARGVITGQGRLRTERDDNRCKHKA
jgi:hypothetical protein